jgi:hypothetical protein
MRDPAEVLGKDPEANELNCTCYPRPDEDCPYHQRIWATRMLVAEVLALRKETGRAPHGELGKAAALHMALTQIRQVCAPFVKDLDGASAGGYSRIASIAEKALALAHAAKKTSKAKR